MKQSAAATGRGSAEDPAGEASAPYRPQGSMSARGLAVGFSVQPTEFPIQLLPNRIQNGIEMNPIRVLPIAICELNRLSAA